MELYFRLVMKFENQAIIQYLPISGISIFLQIFLPITNLIDINIAGLQNNQDGIRMKKSFFLLYAFLFLGLCACSKHVENKFPATTAQGQIEDLKKFPQNLEVYAKLTGPNKRLLTSLEQEQMAGKFINLYFGPWQMRKTSIRKNEVVSLFNHPRGYKHGDIKWQKYEWTAMKDNANLSVFPSMAIPAITLRNTDLRELPTHEYRFSEPTPDPKANPFDYFQSSLLPPGMPVLLVHATLDKRWYYVECPVAGGWVDAKDLAEVDQNFMSIWRSGNYAALVRDKIKLAGTGLNNSDSTAGIGTLLPYRSINNDGSMKVLVPHKKPDGFAGEAEIIIPAWSAVVWPFILTPKNVADVGNVMMRQPYGWGGMFGDRDCSALTRDLFTPFGIWLPRNSSAQARRGLVIPLAGLSKSEKQDAILTNGIPFLSLVGMKGHICLYVGKYDGEAAIFHNVWGLRIVENGNDDARLVVGKAVVTSITPGMEIRNLYRPVTFVDRLRSLTILKK